MPDHWSAWEQTFKAPPCIADAHGECRHLYGHGGGFNRRRLRMEASALLCRCTCHAYCPVTAVRKQTTVPWNTWYLSCVCPGAERARQRMEEAGMDASGPGELWAKARRQSAARFEAFKSARDRSAGRSPQDVRAIYLAELRSRDVPIPSDDAVDRAVERIVGGPLVSARQAGEGLAATGKLLHGVIKILWAVNRPPPSSMPGLSR
jgi:hypothetical protein